MIDATKLLDPAASLQMTTFAAFDAPILAPEPITLEEAKRHLNVVLPDDDTYITGLIVAARQMAEGRLNRTLVRRQLVDSFDATDRAYRLLKPPVVSVDEVTVQDYLRTDVPVAPEDFYLAVNGDRAYLRATPLAPWASAVRRGGTVSVAYTAGYAPGTVPQPIVQWMLLVIGTLYANRETMSTGVQVYSIPDDFVKWLLQPYMVYE